MAIEAFKSKFSFFLLFLFIEFVVWFLTTVISYIYIDQDEFVIDDSLDTLDRIKLYIKSDLVLHRYVPFDI